MPSTATLEQIDLALAQQTRWLEGIVHKAAAHRILGTIPCPKADFWNRVVETASTRPNRLAPLTSKAGIPDAGLILRLLARARSYDLVLLAGGERADLIYVALAGLCPWIRTPHIIVDAHWQKATGTAGLLQRLVLRAGRRLLREVQPHSEEEIGLYARAFGIPAPLLRSIPWSTSLIGYDTESAVPTEPSVLTGGHSFRDYPVFMRAAGELGLTVKMGLSRANVASEVRTLAESFPNIALHTDWDNREYFRQMSACSIYAMPIEQHLTRATADQTILNAMHLGRIVVATDSIGPRIYLRDGVNGFLVREPTVECWKSTLARAHALTPAARAAMVDQAVFDARVRFNEIARLGRTLDNALAVLDPTHRPSWDGQVSQRLVQDREVGLGVNGAHA